ncbi:MAG: SDR family oxidoreductase, partial [Pseudomonadota bacterium]
DAFDAAYTDNVRNVFTLAQATARRMIAQSEDDPDFRGAIVTVTSIAARRTVPELFAHSVSCAALDQLTRSMAACLAEHRIRVNGVAIGSVMTQTLREALKERSDLREEMVRVTPLGRIGEAEEAAEAAVYLASDKASFVTGQIMAVDGGRTVLDPLASPVR